MELLGKDTFTSTDIIELINSNVEESINIEFKSADSLSKEPSAKKEISKDVSAFANSDGGIIFYGINEENHIATSTSFVDGNIFTKEWIENVIISNIQTKIEDLKIIPVRFDNDFKKTVYVVIIPKSNNAPHINGDKRYYRRFNFQSVPMEEYEVRDLYLRHRESRVIIDKIITKPVDELKDGFYSFYIEIQISNDGNFISERYKVACNLSGVTDIGIRYDESKNYNVTHKLELGVKISTSEMIPLFPNELYNALCFTIDIPKEKFSEVTKELKCNLITFNVTDYDVNEMNLSDLLIQTKNKYYN